MPAKIEVKPGNRYGRLTVLKESKKTKHNSRQFKCKCDCGTIRIVRLCHLRSGHTKSCGCLDRERKEGNTDRRKDLSGHKFHMLTVLNLHEIDDGKCIWRCQCDCGKITNVVGADLTKKSNKATKSCGCWSRNLLIGKKFTRLTVKSFSEIKHGKIYWNCICICGNLTVVSTQLLKSGKTRSCGCLMRETSSVTASKRLSTLGKGARIGWTYKNVRMRSSYEIMVAMIFDRYNIQWQYEPRCFKLSESCRYTPDFYLPEYNRWIEVKGHFTDSAKVKVAKFKELGRDIEVWQQREIEYEFGMSNYRFLNKFREEIIL